VSDHPPSLTDYASYILNDDAADAQREWLREFCRWARGDPNLTPGEAEFIVALRRHAEWVDGPLLTAMDAHVATNLAYRLGYLSDAAGDDDE
jgi:hypothetical protein